MLETGAASMGGCDSVGVKNKVGPWEVSWCLIILAVLLKMINTLELLYQNGLMAGLYCTTLLVITHTHMHTHTHTHMHAQVENLQGNELA